MSYLCLNGTTKRPSVPEKTLSGRYESWTGVHPSEMSSTTLTGSYYQFCFCCFFWIKNREQILQEKAIQLFEVPFCCRRSSFLIFTKGPAIGMLSKKQKFWCRQLVGLTYVSKGPGCSRSENKRSRNGKIHFWKDSRNSWMTFIKTCDQWQKRSQVRKRNENMVGFKWRKFLLDRKLKQKWKWKWDGNRNDW